MVDPGTGLVALGAGIGGKELIVKLLGPTADYIGGGIAAWTKNRVENVQRVFDRAQAKLPPGELDRPGAVPPRVLSEVLEGAQFAEDELIADYLGGVLASSRSEVGRDDRTVGMAALIGRLSTYSIRTHYIFYASMQVAEIGKGIDLRTEPAPEIFIPFTQYVRSMDFSQQELRNLNEIAQHVVLTLANEDLFRSSWSYGSGEHLAKKWPRSFPDRGFVVAPSHGGIGLFGIAQGLSEAAAFDAFGDPGRQPAFVGAPDIPDGACLVTDLPEPSPED